MAKNKEKARAEGFARGMKGKDGPSGFCEGWTDDRAATDARTQGYMEGKRKRASGLASRKAARGKK